MLIDKKINELQNLTKRKITNNEIAFYRRTYS